MIGECAQPLAMSGVERARAAHARPLGSFDVSHVDVAGRDTTTLLHRAQHKPPAQVTYTDEEVSC